MTIMHWIFLVYSMTVTTLLFLNLALTICIAHRKIDYIEGFLLNCTAITDEKKTLAACRLDGEILSTNEYIIHSAHS